MSPLPGATPQVQTRHGRRTSRCRGRTFAAALALSFGLSAPFGRAQTVDNPPTPPPPPSTSTPAPPPPAPLPDEKAGQSVSAATPAGEAQPAPDTAWPADPLAGDSSPDEAASDEGAAEVEPIGDLYDLGAQLFEAYAPEEIKERYRFPTREEWDAFAVRLEEALQSSSLRDLAEMEPDARAALAALRALPDYAEYAEWLEDRLDDIAVAQQVASEPPPSPAPTPAPGPAPGRSASPTPATPAPTPVPLYDVWFERMRDRPPPVRAARLVPQLKPVFAEANLPPALVWIAETESSFNPAARSPVGARGLFQLMPGTAKDLGLRLFPFDERLDPLKNATSAARYLARLHARFDDWPLALAAYNAGPARVSRTLERHGARTFAEIADHLPAETRLYVPKVLATIAVREGVSLVDATPAELAAATPSRAF